jgi:FKBP-type peptidyl-prolyl cis-trans isomerase SlyD
MSDPVIGPNAHVTLDYVLRGPKGDVLDDSKSDGGEPIDYVHGYGMLVPGLEAALVGLKAGDEKEVVVKPEDGFGTRDEELVMEVDRSDFPHPEKVKAGDEFVAESPDGDEVSMRVLEVKEEAVVVDANHPLAGVELKYAVVIRTVRVATDEEVATAARELEEARAHVHGPDCDHDHGGGDLVKLGKKQVN